MSVVAAGVVVDVVFIVERSTDADSSPQPPVIITTTATAAVNTPRLKR
jgi:hypothetical protein